MKCLIGSPVQGRQVSPETHLFQCAVHRKRLDFSPSLVVHVESDLAQVPKNVALIVRPSLCVPPRLLLGLNGNDCTLQCLQPTPKRCRIEVNERNPPEAAAFSACRLEENHKV